MKKFELTSESRIFAGKKLFRIKALISFGDVKKGDLGGFIEKEENLGQYGNAWVYGNARVYCDAWVSGDASVSDNARVYGNARVSGNAWVYGDARVYGNASVSGDARVYCDAWVSGDASVSGDDDYATVQGFGSEYRTTTFFRTKEGTIGARCGCFCGTLEEFREKVKETYGETKTAKEYLMVADLMKFRFSEENNERI